MRYIRDDINIKILSNFELPFSEIEEDFEKFKQKAGNYDLAVWRKNIMLNDFNDIEIYNKNFEKLEWSDIVLNFMDFFNTIMPEQVGICIEKDIPRILDNELTYLIIQRKNRADFDENFFIAFDKKVYFPMISKEFDLKFAIVKFAELSKRANKNVVKFQKRTD